MESCGFPRTVEEMLEAGWYNKLLKKVSKSTLRDPLNTPEELVQDIFTQILQSDYLSRYNPEFRPFDVYIYAVADNLIKKRGVRENTKGGKLIVNHASLENSIEDGVLEPNTVYLDVLELEEKTESPENLLYIKQLIASTKASLKEFKATSSVEYDGEVVLRDPATVFDYILDGKSVSEIAEIMQVSKQYIYVMLHKIRSVKAMKEFHNNAVKTHLVKPKVSHP